MKILFLSNIPSPYRLDFFNELGKNIDLKVIFEAERNYDLNENWYQDKFENFEVEFLKSGAIEERKINWKFLSKINKKNQDLIVVTNYAYLTELAALVYIKLKRIPYCMEVDGAIIKEENKLMYLFKRFLIRGANFYMSSSTNTDDFFMHYGVQKSKIYRYPFTSLKEADILKQVASQEQKNKLREELGMKEEKIILSIGQFIHRKGFDILLEAVNKLPRNYGVYIIGDQPTKEYLDLKAKYKLENIQFIDFQSKEELKKYYQAADVFAFPTREDVWGLVVNEAMANGLPVITTDKCVAGLELVKTEDNGYIIETEDVYGLAEKIQVILEDSDLQAKMSRKSLEIIQEYTIEKMVEKHMEILRGR